MTISIVKHGAPFVVQNENRISSGASHSSSLFKSIRHIGNSYEKINFVSCYSANGSCFSNAQMLANASGRPVTGYYGKINILTAKQPTSGRTFRPQHNFIAHICSVGNRLLSCPIQIGFGLKHLVIRPSDGNVR
ncbi:effector protein [Salmonella enterica]